MCTSDSRTSDWTHAPPTAVFPGEPGGERVAATAAVTREDAHAAIASLRAVLLPAGDGMAAQVQLPSDAGTAASTAGWGTRSSGAGEPGQTAGAAAVAQESKMTEADGEEDEEDFFDEEPAII